MPVAKPTLPVMATPVCAALIVPALLMPPPALVVPKLVSLLSAMRYEDVVADLEKQARRIIEYCGLPWDDRCLSFHETERPVRTASATQVRQPIYTSAVGRSRVYEGQLEPLLRGLGIAETVKGQVSGPI